MTTSKRSPLETAAAQAERERISQILALPQAKNNRRGAEGLAFGTSMTVAEAAGALAAAADAPRMFSDPDDQKKYAEGAATVTRLRTAVSGLSADDQKKFDDAAATTRRLLGKEPAL